MSPHCRAHTTLSTGTDVPDTSLNFSFAPGYSKELASIATPPSKPKHPIPHFDPDSLLFAFPFNQTEVTFISPIKTLLPAPPSHDNEDTGFQEDNTRRMVKVVPRRFLFPPGTRNVPATPPATAQRQQSDHAIAGQRPLHFKSYDLQWDRSPEQNHFNTGSSLASPPMFSSPSRLWARSERPESSAAAETHSHSITANANLEAQPCPRNCIQEPFPPELVHQVAQKFNIPPAQILHYRKVDGNFHYCPLDCGHYTFGSSMARHLEKHHPGIEGVTVQCTVKSLAGKGERCLRQPMQGAEFLEHFERDHRVREAVCPFCLAVSATLEKLITEHFEVCPEIERPVKEEECELPVKRGWAVKTMRRKKMPLLRVQKAPGFDMELRPKTRRPARYA